MKKIILTLVAMVGITGAMNAQLIDEKDVTVTMDSPKNIPPRLNP